MEKKETIRDLSKIKKKGLRLTQQRKIILEELRKTTSHPTAEEVYHMVRRKIPHISVGTVYRNLNVLKELGLVRELDYGKECAHFDGRCDEHYHFICESCGKIIDLDKPLGIDFNQVIASNMGLDVKGFRLEFFGFCPECKG